MRTEKTIAERDRDRYLESSTTNFECFREVEKELAAEKEKVRTLEAELARVRTEAIEDFKKSKEYEDLMAAEYDAAFPETFKNCWEAIIGELSSKIEGVSLEQFPVPPIPGKTSESSEDLEETEFGDSHPVETQDEEAQDGVDSPMAEDAEKEEEIPEEEGVPRKGTTILMMVYLRLYSPAWLLFVVILFGYLHQPFRV